MIIHKNLHSISEWFQLFLNISTMTM